MGFQITTSPITAPAPASARSGSRSGQRASKDLPPPATDSPPPIAMPPPSPILRTRTQAEAPVKSITFACYLSSTTLAIINVGLSSTATAV